MSLEGVAEKDRELFTDLQPNGVCLSGFSDYWDWYLLSSLEFSPCFANLFFN